MFGVLRSSIPDLEVPEISLGKFILEKAKKHGDKVALIDYQDGRRITFREFTQLVCRASNGLIRAGMVKSDVISMVATNNIYFPIMLNAALLAGGVVTTCSPLCKADELAYHLRDSGATFVFTQPHLVAVVRNAMPQGQHIKAIYVPGEAEGCTPLSRLLEDPHPGVPEVPIDPLTDVALLPYSSGTEGVSKGVRLSHHAMVTQMIQLSYPPLGLMTPDDVTIGMMPMVHSYGIIMFLTLNFVIGTTTVVSDRFYLTRFLDIIQTYQVTLAHVAPPIISLLGRSPEVDRYDLSSLRTVISGTAHLSRESERRLRERLRGVVTRQLYGLSETNVALLGTTDESSMGTVGYILPNIVCKVIDSEDGHVCGPGEPGELHLRGPQQMLGFHNRPQDQTAMITPDGWIRTGDIVRFTKEGRFDVVDRKKEIMKYKGYQVAPAELDAILLEHSDILDAAVIGVPNEVAGELPKAFVVRHPGSTVTHQQIMDFVAARVAPQKKLRGGVEFISEIPRTSMGKVLRRQLSQIEVERGLQVHY